MKWTEDHATGNEEIDRQHKFLFESTEQFRDVLAQGCTSENYEMFLEFLTAYAEVHFGFEEGCMFAAKCPFYQQNKNEHALFVALAKEKTAEFHEDGFSPDKAVDLLDFVEGWLDSHIRRIDTKLREAA